MSIEKQIEEMSGAIQDAVAGCSSYWVGLIATHLYNIGYRKQKKGSWKVIKPSRENGEPSYICSVCGAVYHEDVREWKGCPKCLSEMRHIICLM